MSNEDDMLQLVLSDNNLSSYFDFKSEECTTVKDALKSDNPIVVAVAKIIRGIKGRPGKSLHKEVYTEVFNYLNQNML